MKYGMNIMKDVMLRGLPLPAVYIGGLALIGLIMFFADWVILRRIMLEILPSAASIKCDYTFPNRLSLAA